MVLVSKHCWFQYFGKEQLAILNELHVVGQIKNKKGCNQNSCPQDSEKERADKDDPMEC